MAITPLTYWSSEGFYAIDFPDGVKGITHWADEGIPEFYSLIQDLSFSLNESINVLEDVNFGYYELGIFVFEFEYVVVNEHVDVLDEVVELGIAPEYIYIEEHQHVHLDRLDIHDHDAFNDIAVEEYSLIDVLTLPDNDIYIAEYLLAIEEEVFTELLISIDFVQDQIGVTDEASVEFDIYAFPMFVYERKRRIQLVEV